MKTMKWMMTLMTALCLSSPLLHGHDEHGTKKAGPNGGRLLTSTEPHAEFFVTPERKVRITFLGEDGKPVLPEKAEASLTGGDRANPTKLTFTKDGTSLLSDKPLPEGQNVPVVLRFSAGSEKPVTEKFGVNLADCEECQHKEYACTCAHGS